MLDFRFYNWYNINVLRYRASKKVWNLASDLIKILYKELVFYGRNKKIN